jgi:NAD(P)-dependent dehydrogenase (short-subunit alcohol dehydrogenase family)
VEVVAADLSQPAEAQRLAERVLAITSIPADADAGALAMEGQGLYLLVNNAGGGVATGFSALEGEQRS